MSGGELSGKRSETRATETYSRDSAEVEQVHKVRDAGNPTTAIASLIAKEMTDLVREANRKGQEAVLKKWRTLLNRVMIMLKTRSSTFSSSRMYELRVSLSGTWLKSRRRKVGGMVYRDDEREWKGVGNATFAL